MSPAPAPGVFPWEHRARPDMQPRPDADQPKGQRGFRERTDDQISNRQLLANATTDAEQALFADHQPAYYAKVATDVAVCAACHTGIDAGTRQVTVIQKGSTRVMHRGCATRYSSKRLGLT